ncbi:right-handed parallel beta-helix repeat-containing protein [Candidatus Woesearchaeota archaeon]|nr:right-handed parallel beta-helix repeat-containing protein [Candidatus Woesearchaeota archaeon]
MQKGVFLIILLILSIISIQLAYSTDNLSVREAIKNPFSFILGLININSISGNTINEITGNVPFDPTITIFVDNSLSVDCIGQYNPDNAIGNRCDGSDVFDAYDTLQEAADIVNPGDTVMVRGGTYTRPNGGSSTRVLQIKRSGDVNDRIVFSNYNNEQVIIDGENANYYSVQVGTASNPGNYVTINGFIVKNAANAMIYVQNSLGVIISNNTAYNDDLVFNEVTGNVDGGVGIVFAGNVIDSVIEYNHVFNTEYGIRIVNSQNPIVRWNNVHHSHIECDQTNPDCALVQNHAQCISVADGVLGGVIEDNLVHHCDDAGIVGRHSTNGRIFRNNIAYLIDYTDNGGNGYCLRSFGENIASTAPDVMYNNIVFGCQTGIEINVYQPEMGVVAFNNIAYRNKEKGITVGDPYLYSLIFDNAAFDNNQAGGTRKDIHYSVNADDTKIDYNYYGTIQDAVGNSHSITTAQYLPTNQFNDLSLLAFNPGETPSVLLPLDDGLGIYYTDTKGAINYAKSIMQQTFNSKQGSALIDSGTVLSNLHCQTADEQGNCRTWYGEKPDIGAFEFNPTKYIYVDNQLNSDCLNVNGKHYVPTLARGTGCVDGSIGLEAYDTLQEAANVVIPGDEVLVRGGTYNDNFQILRSGTATDRITFKNYPNEEPILDEQATRGHCILIGDYTGTGSYVTIDGFTCKNIAQTGVAVGISVRGSNNVIIRNSHLYQDDYPGYPGRITATDSTDYSIIQTYSMIGISIQGTATDNIVENNDLHNMLTGVRLRFADPYGAPIRPIVRYNHIHHMNFDCKGNVNCDNLYSNNAQGIAVSNLAHDSIIEYNVIHHIDDAGTQSDRTRGNTWRYNIAYFNDPYDTPGGGGPGIKQHDNWVDDASNPPVSDKVYGNIVFGNFQGLQTNSKNVASAVPIYNVNNLVYGSKQRGITVTAFSTALPEKNSFIENNAIFSSGLLVGSLDIAYPGSDNLHSNYNFVSDLLANPSSYQSANPQNNLQSITGDINQMFTNPDLLSFTYEPITNIPTTPTALLPLNNPDAFANGRDAYDYALQQVKDAFSLKQGSVLIDAGVFIPEIHCPNPGPDSSGCREWYGLAPDIGAFEYIEQCTNGETRLCNLQQGVCSGSIEVCTSNLWPGCSSNNYGINYEITESSCSDSLDNDCDGLTDLLDNGCLTTTTTVFTTTTTVLTSSTTAITSTTTALTTTTTALTTSTTSFTSTTTQLTTSTSTSSTTSSTTLPITTTTTSSSTSSTTIAILPQCNDGYDNDNDGLIDYPADPGCDSFNDNDETKFISETTTTGSSGGGSGGGRRLTVEACTEDWVCFNWLNCVNGIEQRDCIDYNNCGTYLLKPVTERSCVPEEKTRLKPPVREEERRIDEIKPAQVEQERKIATTSVIISELNKNKQLLILSVSITIILSYLVYSIVMHRRWNRFKR